MRNYLSTPNGVSVRPRWCDLHLINYQETIRECLCRFVANGWSTLFAAVTAKAIAEFMSTGAEKMLEIAKSFFGRLSPSITINDQGRPEITFGSKRFGEPGPELDEVLECLERLQLREREG